MNLMVDWEIEEALDHGEIEIDPIADRSVQIQPCSVDLRIGHKFLRYRHAPVGADARLRLGQDLSTEMAVTHVDGGLILNPQEFALGATIERVKLPANIMARVEGRSSVGRTGLFVHVTAGFIDPGFDGRLTLELFNGSPRPIVIPVGHRICQLAISRLSSAARRPYGAARGSKYVDDAATGVTASRKEHSR